MAAIAEDEETAHQIENTSRSELDYLRVATNDDPDVVECLILFSRTLANAVQITGQKWT